MAEKMIRGEFEGIFRARSRCTLFEEDWLIIFDMKLWSSKVLYVLADIVFLRLTNGGQ